MEENSARTTNLEPLKSIRRRQGRLDEEIRLVVLMPKDKGNKRLHGQLTFLPHAEDPMLYVSSPCASPGAWASQIDKTIGYTNH